ncbi:MAG: carbohydrate-binding protein, partial [Sphingobacteriia bacterium 32-37-4]
MMIKILATILLFSLGIAESIGQNRQKIPIDGNRWYQLTNVEKGLQQLFDGDLFTAVDAQFDKIIPLHESYYPLLKGESMVIDSIRFYDWTGISTKPFTLYIIDSSWNRKVIASFDGSKYNRWVGPYPERPDIIKLDVAARNIMYLLIVAENDFPSEIECYGYYTPPSASNPVLKRKNPLSNLLGINGYEWNFSDPLIDPFVVNSKKLNAVKHFSGFRHYLDWQKLEYKQGSYTYSPTRSGSWNYDAIYETCLKEGIAVLACLKTLPSWMIDSYPDSLKDLENNPVFYGKNLNDPASYIDQAKLAFQFAARYGKNKTVDQRLLNVYDTARWTGDEINQVKVGLGLIEYMECENERDKWWKGRKAYQTGREYAANLSAFYDGHKNTLGIGVGVKNADSNMKVVMAGVALATTDYFRGMIDWCKEFRGFNPDGTVNICWDIINYHLYTNSTSLNRAIAPELKSINTNADSIAKAFIQSAAVYLNNMPVWVTETGFDINPNSPNKAIAIGNKSILQTQADWILRTALLYSRNGIVKQFFYQLEDDSPNSDQLYATSGLFGNQLSARPAADFIKQTKELFGSYYFNKTINADPIVDEYLLNDTSAMYVVYIPDEKGRTGLYTLDLGSADSAYLYTPAAGMATMELSKLKTTNGKVIVTATETPLFIKGVGFTSQVPNSTTGI